MKSAPHCEACFQPKLLWRAQSMYADQSRYYCWHCLHQFATRAEFKCSHTTYRIRQEFASKAAMRRWRLNARNEICGACLKAAWERGATIVASNSDHDGIRSLYYWAQIRSVALKYTVGGANQKTGQEVIIIGGHNGTL